MRVSSILPQALGAIALFTLAGCSSGVPETASPDSPASSPLTAEPDSEGDTATSVESALMPGQHCFTATTDTLDAAVRLMVSPDGKVTGDGMATISDDANSYYTSYRQALTGNIRGYELALNIKTWIEYDVQTAQETWTLDGDTLTGGNDAYGVVGCEEVAERFAGAADVEAEDLLSAATNVNTQRVKFDPGTTSTVVSNGVVRGDRDVYIIGAQGGQSMALAIKALEDNAVFDVVSPSGMVLGVENTEAELVLTETGDYQVIVGGTRGNASYDLSIEVL